MRTKVKLALLLFIALALCGVALYRHSSTSPAIDYRLPDIYRIHSFFREGNKTIAPAILMGAKDPRRAFTVVDHSHASPGAVLTASPGLLGNGKKVNVSWVGVTRASAGDWIGMYCPPNSDLQGYLDYWLVAASPTHLSGRGSVELMMFNMRMECQFRYFAALGDSAYSLVAVSKPVRFIDGVRAPLHAHLALTGRASEMRVQWTSGTNDTPIVVYGLLGSSDDASKNATGVSRTYTNTDMCGPPANSSVFFMDPGFMHDVLLTDLRPNTKYFYRVGSANVFSKVRHFITGLEAGNATPFTAIAYGDMDFTPAAELVASQVYQEIIAGSSLVAHVGDLSYACGMSFRWDQWMTLIEPCSSIAPYMINIGNHDQVHIGGGSKDPSMEGEGFHPAWGNYWHDSGGECGVPTASRFHMPDNGHEPWWYSYEYGLVHFTQISSENDYTRGSQQFKWLENDLKSVDREKTPWLIFTSHRPLYNSEYGFTDDHKVVVKMCAELEDLLHQYRVDLALCGHYHGYQRSCAVYKGRCCEDGSACTVHITVGTAGMEMDKEDFHDASWSKHFEKSYGYGKITVANRSALQWQYFRSSSKSISDSVWLRK